MYVRTLVSEFLIVIHRNVTAQFVILDCTICILDCTNWLNCTLRIWPAVCFSHSLEYFKNNFTAKYLKVPAHINPNMGDLVQREHPQN